MSSVTINQIKASFDGMYSSKIVINENVSDEEKRNLFYTRSLAAYSIQYYCKIEPDQVVNYITDGYQDNGIDAIYFNELNHTLYFVQSKWHNDGTGGIDIGDIQKFLQGVKDIINQKYDRFNEKIKSMEDYINSAITTIGTKMFLILCHTGTQKLNPSATRIMDDFIGDINNPDKIADYFLLTQTHIYNNLLKGTNTDKINLDLMLNNWGIEKEPYKCYYGSISANDLGELWVKYNPSIFSSNIRNFLGFSDVNKEITETLGKAPENFFVFNNG
ncbi:MAG: AIPR family protein, partial [Spirochaetaceae bacterium]|nr:AIPR family protein [Spirochaetaceae bacterium]